MPQVDIRPLQSLLLFQTIALHGAQADTFVKAASFLRQSNWFENAEHDPQFDPAKLQDLFITLLKHRAKQELLAALDKDNKNLSSTPARSKRELSPNKKRVTSPKITTLEDARKHEYLVPKMLPDLYADYREQIIRDIKADEQRYSALLSELQSAAESEHDLPRGPSSDTITSNGGHNAPSTRVNELEERISSSESDAAAPVRKQPTGNLENRPAEDQNAVYQSVSSADDIRQRAVPHLQSISSAAETQPTPLQTSPSAIPQSESITEATHTKQQSAQRTARQESQLHQASPRSSNAATQQVSDPVNKRPSQTPSTSATSTPIASRQHSQSALGVRNGPPTSAAPRPGPVYPRTIRPQQSGVLLQPFQVTPQAAKAQPTPTLPKAASATPSRPQARSATDQVRAPASTAPQTPAASAPHLRPVVPNSLPQLRKPINGILSPGSSTIWRRPKTQFVPKQFVQRSFSPLSDEEDTGPTQQTPLQASKPGRQTRNPPALPSRSSGRTIKSGASKTPSVAGTSFNARTRSQSISSYAEGASLATPIAESDLENGTPSGTAHRNKRPGTEDDASASGPPTRGDTVVAWRNFNRMSQALMDIITSHRHGTRFQNSVTKSSTKLEGYEDIVKQPQDLKSIKQAISAGTRAVNAAIAAVESSDEGSAPGILGNNGSSITLPISGDLMPPKAIVNADQLEQELMRMFANAFLFNQGIGPEGVPGEALDMFRDVEEYLRQWRETNIGEEGVVEKAGTPREEDGGGRKRRRYG